VVRLFVRNWRCVEEVEVALEPVTVFIGGNSTGKSSLAYAPYFLTKVVEWRDANRVLMQLYGVQLDGVVRSAEGKRFYPVVVEAGGSRFEARGPSDITIPEGSPWASGFLLPSQRLSFARVSRFIPRLGRELGRPKGCSSSHRAFSRRSSPDSPKRILVDLGDRFKAGK